MRRQSPAALLLLALCFALLPAPGCKDSSDRRKRKFPVPSVLINEIVPGGAGAGAAPGWIEVFNSSAKKVNLSRVFLSDDESDPLLYRLPKQKLRPGEFLVVICDGQPDLGPLHAPFTLDAAGETVLLHAKKGKLELDRQEYVNLEPGVSVGRFPDGTDTEYGIIYVPTQGEPNLPVGVKLPRVDGTAGLLLSGSEPDAPLSLTVPVLEDRELLNATVEIQPVASCDDPVDPGGFQGPFPLDIVDDLSGERIEDRRDHLDQPIQVTVQELTLFASLPHFDEGTRLELRFRLENVMGEVFEEQCEVVASLRPRVEPVFDDPVWVEPRCPQPTQSPEVFTFVSIDEKTVEQDTPETPTFEVEFTYQAGGAAPVTVTRQSGLEVVEADACMRECYQPEAIADSRMFRVLHRIPPASAGTLVTFSFRVRDLDIPAEAVHEESPQTAMTSFRYLSGFQPPPLTINEFLPESNTVLEELYPAAVRNDPAFQPPDFAELYNAADQTADVGGFFLARARDRVCAADGSACPSDLIRKVREFRVPDGTSIPRKEFLVFLFVSDDRRNTAPQLAGTVLENKTVLVSNSIELDDCRETLFLISRDADGNCPVDRADWDFRTPVEIAQGLECAQTSPDRSRGRLPDGEPGIIELEIPTPGESNCIYRPPEISGDVVTLVLGPRPDETCITSQNRVDVRWATLIALRETILNPDDGARPAEGVQSVEVIIEKDGVAEPAVPLDSFPSSIERRDLPQTPVCQARLEFQATLPAPAGGEDVEVVTYRIRITDTRGESVIVGPLAFDICERPFLFIRGDVNGDQRINVTDVTLLVRVVFEVLPEPPCLDPLDVDDNGVLEPADTTRLADFVVRIGPRIPDPYPEPGVDPTPDDLRCESGDGP